MSARKPNPDEPNNIEFGLKQIEIDTAKARAMPTPEQYGALTEKVAAMEVGKAFPKATPWENYSADLERLLDLLPKKDSEAPSRQYYAVKAKKYYNKPLWDEFYDFMLDFFHNQAEKEYPSKQEKEFWEVCFRKYLEMSIEYKDLIS